MLFADDAALTAHLGEALQRLVNRFVPACREFGLTINLEKTSVIARDASQVPSVTINDYTLQVVEVFTYLGSNISNNLSLDTELNPSPSPKDWEAVAEDRTAWRQATRRCIERADETKHQHAAENHHCHPVSSALAEARTANHEPAFTATVDAAKIRQVDNGAH